jgi:hypothetical protein
MRVFGLQARSFRPPGVARHGTLVTVYRNGVLILTTSNDDECIDGSPFYTT